MSSYRADQLGPIIEVRCCRIWPVYVLWRWGRCGRCGRRPERFDPQEPRR